MRKMSGTLQHDPGDRSGSSPALYHLVLGRVDLIVGTIDDEDRHSKLVHDGVQRSRCQVAGALEFTKDQRGVPKSMTSPRSPHCERV